MQEAADPSALIIFGATFDEDLEDEIRVTVIATGFDEKPTLGGKTTTGTAGRTGGKLYGGENNPTGGSPVVPEPADEDDDPYKEIFKIFNRER